MQHILDTFSLSMNQFDEIQVDCQRFIQDMKSPEHESIRTRLFPYLDLLDPSISMYAQFGADKCSLSDFEKWCQLLDVTEIPNDQHDAFHCVSRDQKVTFTCGTLQNNYIHYLGVTGQFEKVVEAFTLFLEIGRHSELCWGNRNYI